MLDKLAVIILAIIKLISSMFSAFTNSAQIPFREGVVLQLLDLSKVSASPWLLSILPSEHRRKYVLIPAQSRRAYAEPFLPCRTGTIASTRFRLR